MNDTKELIAIIVGLTVSLIAIVAGIAIGCTVTTLDSDRLIHQKVSACLSVPSRQWIGDNCISTGATK